VGIHQHVTFIGLLRRNWYRMVTSGELPWFKEILNTVFDVFSSSELAWFFSRAQRYVVAPCICVA